MTLRTPAHRRRVARSFSDTQLTGGREPDDVPQVLPMRQTLYRVVGRMNGRRDTRTYTRRDDAEARVRLLRRHGTFERVDVAYVEWQTVDPEGIR